jgi:ribosome recycling factor
MSYNFSPLEAELQAAYDWLVSEYMTLSAGRAHPALLDSVLVDSYGSFQPIKNVASVTNEDVRTLRIVPWDKSQIKDIERAIQKAELPVGVQSDSDSVRVSVPALTTETRAKTVKLAKEKYEDARVRVRQIRQHHEKHLEKHATDVSLGKDDLFRFKEMLQKKIDSINERLESLVAAKEKEIMTI